MSYPAGTVREVGETSAGRSGRSRGRGSGDVRGVRRMEREKMLDVTLQQIEGWLQEDEPAPIDRTAVLAETRERIDGWNELGGTLCHGFVDVAERVATPA